MKFTVSLNGQEVILTPEQVRQLSELLYGCEMLTAQYLGAGKGTNGQDYLTVLQPFNIRNQLKLSPLVDEEYDALKFVTAAQPKK
jgi:aerobic-type carbon monoxide dehydrogenase small subunit (CoxS/CutS family)